MNIWFLLQLLMILVMGNVISWLIIGYAQELLYRNDHE